MSQEGAGVIGLQMGSNQGATQSGLYPFLFSIPNLYRLLQTNAYIYTTCIKPIVLILTEWFVLKFSVYHKL